MDPLNIDTNSNTFGATGNNNNNGSNNNNNLDFHSFHNENNNFSSSFQQYQQQQQHKDDDGEEEDHHQHQQTPDTPIKIIHQRWKPISEIIKTPSCCDIGKSFSFLLTKPKIQYKFDYSTFKQAPIIQITENQKASDMTGSSYTLYLIQTLIPGQLHRESKHRYSEFEALRRVLHRLHPTCVVPTIPEKHSLGDYATKPTTAKDDPIMIDKRKRMLTNFLNRILNHPILSRHHAFHLFLEGKHTWNEIVSMLDLSKILKSKDESKGYLNKSVAKRSDPLFSEADEFTSKFAAHITHTHRLHKKISKRHAEEKLHFTELGHAYNTWSLIEKAPLSTCIEKVGEAFDAMSLVQSRYSGIMDHQLSEAFQEYVQFANVVERLIKWRYVKTMQHGKVEDKLQQKTAELNRLEASESEALRISAVLSSEGVGLSAASSRPSGLIATINSFIDHDPETTRRKTISKLKDRIVELKEDLECLKAELSLANTEIQQDLDRFQMVKVEDMKSIWLEYAHFMKQYHTKNRDIWKTCQAQTNN